MFKAGAIALSYPPRVRVRATVKHSAAFFPDESSITKRGGGEGEGGGYESAIAPQSVCNAFFCAFFIYHMFNFCSI